MKSNKVARNFLSRLYFSEVEVFVAIFDIKVQYAKKLTLDSSSQYMKSPAILCEQRYPISTSPFPHTILAIIRRKQTRNQ